MAAKKSDMLLRLLLEHKINDLETGSFPRSS
jgi:hypothetical protein